MAIGGCVGLPSSAERAHSTALTDTGTPVSAALSPGSSTPTPARPASMRSTTRATRSPRACCWPRRRAQPRRAVLHLAQRHHRQPAVRGAAGSAAERGVRVRLLLDDNNTRGLDDALAALDAHPNIEVRLFNPFASRGLRALGYLTDFARLNRRMHNKSFTADNQATIVGGRNIGDEYFGAGERRARSPTSTCSRSARSCREVSSEFDALLEQRVGVPGGRLVSPTAAGRGAALERAAGADSTTGPAAARTSRRCAPRRSCASCSRGSCRSNGRRRAWCSDDPAKVLHPPRAHRTAPAAAPRSGDGRAASASWTWSRRTSCRARTAPRRCARWPSAA